MKDENKKYNASDFARYHAGTMPADEMHALEKAALDDPFLADALEGYAYSLDAAKESAVLESRLHKRIVEKKRKGIYFLSENKWLKIAAMLVLVGGSAVLFLITNNPEKKSLAVQQEIAQKDSTALVSQLKTDAPGHDENIALKEAASKASEKGVSAQSASPIKKSSQKAAPDTEKKLLVEEKEHPAKKTEALQEPIVVMNNSKAQSPVPTPQQSETKSHLPETEISNAGKPARKNVAFDSGNALVATSKERMLKESAYTDKLNRKKLAFQDDSMLKEKVSGVVVNKNAALPVGGIEAFEQYIKDSVRIITDTSGRRLGGNILLEFTINKNGKPEHIEIVQSDCGACEQEAIRLLEKGPQWVGSRGIIWIRF